VDIKRQYDIDCDCGYEDRDDLLNRIGHDIKRYEKEGKCVQLVVNAPNIWQKSIACVLVFILITGFCILIGLHVLYFAVCGAIVSLCVEGCFRAILSKIGLIHHS